MLAKLTWVLEVVAFQRLVPAGDAEIFSDNPFVSALLRNLR
jgi:hypothetical protein